jgi:hypothetical protein
MLLNFQMLVSLNLENLVLFNILIVDFYKPFGELKKAILPPGSEVTLA